MFLVSLPLTGTHSIGVKIANGILCKLHMLSVWYTYVRKFVYLNKFLRPKKQSKGSIDRLCFPFLYGHRGRKAVGRHTTIVKMDAQQVKILPMPLPFSFIYRLYILTIPHLCLYLNSLVSSYSLSVPAALLLVLKSIENPSCIALIVRISFKYTPKYKYLGLSLLTKESFPCSSKSLYLPSLHCHWKNGNRQQLCARF